MQHQHYLATQSGISGVSDTQPLESTGGYVSPSQRSSQKAAAFAEKAKTSMTSLNTTAKKRRYVEEDGCPHDDVIGDRCVASCRNCGIFLPNAGSRVLRNQETMSFQCCFPMTEILRTTYAECMQERPPMVVHQQYVQMRKMLVEWLIEGGEQLKLMTRTIF